MASQTNQSFWDPAANMAKITPLLAYADTASPARFIFTFGSLIAVVAFFISRALSNPVDQYGRKIPEGPIGLPIVGKS